MVSFYSLSVEVHVCDVFLFNLRFPSATVVLVLLCIEWKNKCMWSELFSISVESHGVAAVHEHALQSRMGKKD